MSDTSNGEGWWIGLFFLFWMWYLFFMFVIPHSYRHMDVVFLVSLIATIFTACVIAAIIRDRPETTLKIGEVLDDDTLDIYTPVRTSKQWDIVTPIDTIEEVGKYAECPYCGSNIRETFYEHGGIVRCDKCGALHHKECFEYYGRKCGSSSCKLREA
ncbi:MAG: hypothetical protein N2V75_05070 [Methanophagales archaeon]|nr:hypothetical protein [Methanophagales archaeon]